MGVCYEMHDLTNRRRFDLNKGQWFWLRDLATVRTLDLEHFTAKLRHYWNESCVDGPLDDADKRYFTKVAEKLFAFCVEADWNVELVDDTDDVGWERKEAGWQLTDSRFFEGAMEDT